MRSDGPPDLSSGVLSSLRAIYEQNGLLGFFSGLVPRLLGDLLSALLVASLTYVVNNYVVEDKELKTYTGSTMAVCRLSHKRR